MVWAMLTGEFAKSAISDEFSSATWAKIADCSNGLQAFQKPEAVYRSVLGCFVFILWVSATWI